MFFNIFCSREKNIDARRPNSNYDAVLLQESWVSSVEKIYCESGRFWTAHTRRVVYGRAEITTEPKRWKTTKKKKKTQKYNADTLLR